MGPLLNSPQITQLESAICFLPEPWRIWFLRSFPAPKKDACRQGRAGPLGVPVFTGASLPGSLGSGERGSGRHVIPGIQSHWEKDQRGPGRHSLWEPRSPKSGQVCRPLWWGGSQQGVISPTEAGLSRPVLSASVTLGRRSHPQSLGCLPCQPCVDHTSSGPHMMLAQCRGRSLCRLTSCCHKQLLL